MAYAVELYQKDGLAKRGDWLSEPKGIQHIGQELFPSWYNKSKAQTGVKMTFDKVSKKKATSCTPAGAKVELSVTKTKDPVTNKDIFLAPDGYDATADDDVHKCGDTKPLVNSILVEGNKISVNVTKGKFPLDTLTIRVNGESIASRSITSSGTYSTYYTFKSDAATIVATITDTAYYEASLSQSHTVSSPPGDSDGGGSSSESLRRRLDR